MALDERRDLPAHSGPESCLEFTESATQGRFLIAAHDISIGDCVLTAHVFAATVIPRRQPVVCARCLLVLSEPLRVRTCSKGCGVGFCSDECQAADEALHAIECPLRWKLKSANFNDYTVALTILAVRCLLLRDSNEVGFQEVLALCNHRGLAPMQLVADFRAAERIAQRSTKLLQNQDVVGFMMRGYSNAFARRDPDGETAVVLAPIGAYFNHSCAPNVCCENSEGLQLRFWALDSSCEGDALHISYVDIPMDVAEPLAKTEARRRHLQDHYFFHCGCEICSRSSTCCKWAKSRLCRNSTVCRKRGFLIPREDGRRECCLCHAVVSVQ